MSKFSSKLLDWYFINKRFLEWRDTREPYRVWISEIVLQQTQVSQGRPYYKKIISTYPDVEALGNASEDDLMKIWQGLGYYSRARHLHETAKYISLELGGCFPNKYEELIKLKGVGSYTAAAIASFCFDEPVAVVDGNVYRVLARYFGIETPINTTQGVRQFRELANKLMDADNISDYNQAIMEFGALQCRPQSPDCRTCPLSQNCLAFNTNRIKELPKKIKKQPIKNRYFNYLIVIDKNDRTILNQRHSNDIWKKLYEFPLIETSSTASKSDILGSEKISLITRNISELKLLNDKEIIHKLTHRHIYTQFWKLSISETLSAGISFKDLNNYAMPTLISTFLKKNYLNIFKKSTTFDFEN